MYTRVQRTGEKCKSYLARSQEQLQFLLVPAKLHIAYTTRYVDSYRHKPILLLQHQHPSGLSEKQHLLKMMKSNTLLSILKILPLSLCSCLIVFVTAFRGWKSLPIGSPCHQPFSKLTGTFLAKSEGSKLRYGQCADFMEHWHLSVDFTDACTGY